MASARWHAVQGKAHAAGNKSVRAKSAANANFFAARAGRNHNDCRNDPRHEDFSWTTMAWCQRTAEVLAFEGTKADLIQEETSNQLFSRKLAGSLL